MAENKEKTMSLTAHLGSCILLTLILLSVNGCQNITVVAELPMSYPGHTIEGCDTFLVPIRIGSNEYLFFVDTGATYTAIDDDLKPFVGKFIGVRIPDYSWDGLPLEFCRIENPIEIGQMKLRGKVACRDFDKIVPECNIDGVLGLDVMRRFIVQIDFQNNLFRLLKKSSSNSSIVEDWGVRVPLVIDSHGFVCIKLNLQDGLDENFILDSGIWGQGLLREKTFEILKDKGQLTEKLSNGYRYVVLPGAFIGECRVSNLGFVAYPESKLVTGRSMLGTQFLGQFKMVTFDLSKEEIYLMPF